LSLLLQLHFDLAFWFGQFVKALESTEKSPIGLLASLIKITYERMPLNKLRTNLFLLYVLISGKDCEAKYISEVVLDLMGLVQR
jgi:hypothetical protein